jgi:peptidoglycan hydrolase FlgJ
MTPITSLTGPKSGTSDAALHAVAKRLEATFLAEMLKHAGFGKASENFGGAEGEAQFASFFVQAQADAMVEAGGIGLAETIFHAMKEKTHDQR